jgi:hypothetical protein
LNSWTTSELEELTKCLTVICNGQKAFGKDVNVRDVFAYFRMKFECRYSVEKVIWAIDSYTDKRNDIPAPSDILAILNPPEPEPPRISDAAYVSAQKALERCGWMGPSATEHEEVVARYREQQKREFSGYERKVSALRLGGPEGGGFRRLSAPKVQEVSA